MKKIFTLIAVAVMAMSANAQEMYKVEEGYLPDNAGIKVKAGKGGNSTSVDIEFGADGKWKEAGAYGGFEPFTAYVAGSNNPKDGEVDGSKSTGSGYDVAKKNLPKSGTYYIFTPTKAGSLKVAMVLNANKSFFVVKSDGTAISDYDIKDKNGEVVAVRAYVEDASNFCSTEAKVYGYATFNVEAGQSYYVFCTGSKLGLFGFEFSETAATIDPATTAAVKAEIDGTSGINTVKNVNSAIAPVYNLAGQQVDKNYKGVVIQNGKKMIQK